MRNCIIAKVHPASKNVELEKGVCSFKNWEQDRTERVPQILCTPQQLCVLGTGSIHIVFILPAQMRWIHKQIQWMTCGNLDVLLQQKQQVRVGIEHANRYLKGTCLHSIRWRRPHCLIDCSKSSAGFWNNIARTMWRLSNKYTKSWVSIAVAYLIRWICVRK